MRERFPGPQGRIGLDGGGAPGTGVDVRYDVYEDEGHVFTKAENEARAFGDMAEFLIDHLAGRIPAAAGG